MRGFGTQTGVLVDTVTETFTETFLRGISDESRTAINFRGAEASSERRKIFIGMDYFCVLLEKQPTAFITYSLEAV